MNLGLRVKQEDLDLEPAQLTESLFEQFKPIRNDRVLLQNIDKLVDTTLKDLAVIEAEVNDYAHSSYLDLQTKIKKHKECLDRVTPATLKSSFAEVLLLTDQTYKYVRPHTDQILEGLDERENSLNLQRICSDLCENFLRGNDLGLDKMSSLERNRTLLRTFQLLCWLTSDQIPIFLTSIYSQENLETILPKAQKSFENQLKFLIEKVKKIMNSESPDYEMIKSSFEYLKKIQKIEEINNFFLDSFPNLNLDEEVQISAPPKKLKDTIDPRFLEIIGPIFSDLEKVEELLIAAKQEDFEFSKLISLIFKTKIHENIENILKNYENNLQKFLNQISFFCENLEQNLEKLKIIDNFDRQNLIKAAFGDLIDENYDIMESEFLQDSLPAHPFVIFPSIFVDEETQNFDFSEFPSLSKFAPENFIQKLIESTKETLNRAYKVKCENSLLDFYKNIFTNHFTGNLKSHIFSVSEKMCETFSNVFDIENYFCEIPKKNSLEKIFSSDQISKIAEVEYQLSAASVLMEWIKIVSESFFLSTEIVENNFNSVFENDILMSTTVNDEFKNDTNEIVSVINNLMETYRKLIVKIYEKILRKLNQEHFCVLEKKIEKNFMKKLIIKKNLKNENLTLQEICSEIYEFFVQLRDTNFSFLFEKVEVATSTQIFRNLVFCDLISSTLKVLKNFRFNVADSAFSNILALTDVVHDGIVSIEKPAENSLLATRMDILKYLHTIFMIPSTNNDILHPEKIFKNVMPTYFEEWKKLDEGEFMSFLRARVE